MKDCWWAAQVTKMAGHFTIYVGKLSQTWEQILQFTRRELD